ncbi:MAG TPA: double zinc ribbon domain-containing protein [Candidatus Wujingus californicus]|uniref:double zinc ribbon domain-containing protein n=1 Tax=Candidatus Wujingus californicus TaxID=3367618 RepID=UPI004025F95F
MTITRYLHTFLDIFYPRYCVHCKCSLNNSYEMYICEDCKKKISYVIDTHCSRCGTILGPYTIKSKEAGCLVCKSKHFYFDKVTCITHYDGVIKTLIYKFKYAGQKFLFNALYDIINTQKKFNGLVSDIDIIVPVPLHWMKELRRGFNQSEILSYGIQKHFLKPVIKNNLRRIRNTKAQTLLTKGQRKINIKNAFSVKSPELFKGKNVLLVDDVLTTGMTASECSRKLKESGAKFIHLFVIATAEYNHDLNFLDG